MARSNRELDKFYQEVDCVDHDGGSFPVENSVNI